MSKYDEGDHSHEEDFLIRRHIRRMYADASAHVHLLCAESDPVAATLLKTVKEGGVFLVCKLCNFVAAAGADTYTARLIREDMLGYRDPETAMPAVLLPEGKCPACKRIADGMTMPEAIEDICKGANKECKEPA